MNRAKSCILTAVAFAAAAVIVFSSLPLYVARAAEGPQKSTADIEKEKALQNPYSNDYGPAELDQKTLDSYPGNIQAGYKTLLGNMKTKNCQTCHTAARPLNSRFVEVEGKTDAEREANLAKLKKSNPELFKDASVWQIEAKVWNRYVKRMMAKPGCGISSADGKKIWEFLVYDGKRKIGANAQKWKAHRLKLIEKLKSEKPQRYEELAKDKDL